MKEAILYKKLKNKKIQCQNCAHYCQISPNKRGICGVRENISGKLFALNYGKAAALNIDPIEKKPLYHFLPGTYSLSFATVGCNFKCLKCQNWDISQMPQTSGRIEGEDILPQEIVKIALDNNLPSISYTYTEPAIFSEYALDTMKLAQKQGLKNIWVGHCLKFHLLSLGTNLWPNVTLNSSKMCLISLVFSRKLFGPLNGISRVSLMG